MSRKAISIAFLVALSALMLVAAGCGDKKSSTTQASAQTEAAATTEAATTEESTTTESTDTDATDTDSGGSGATSQECKDFATAASSVGTEFSQALSGTGDISKASEAFDELTAKAPDDIKDDFQTIDDAFKKMADALKGVDLSSGKTPDADTLAKLQKLGTEIDQTKLSQASANISAWASKNCSS